MRVCFVLLWLSLALGQDVQRWVNFRVDSHLNSTQRSDLETVILTFYANLVPPVFPSRVSFSYLQLSPAVTGSTSGTNDVTDIGVTIQPISASLRAQSSAEAGSSALRDAVNGGTGSSSLRPPLQQAVGDGVGIAVVPAFSGKGSWSALQALNPPSAATAASDGLGSLEVSIIVLLIVACILILALALLVALLCRAQPRSISATKLSASPFDVGAGTATAVAPTQTLVAPTPTAVQSASATFAPRRSTIGDSHNAPATAGGGEGADGTARRGSVSAASPRKSVEIRGDGGGNGGKGDGAEGEGGGGGDALNGAAALPTVKGGAGADEGGGGDDAGRKTVDADTEAGGGKALHPTLAKAVATVCAPAVDAPADSARLNRLAAGRLESDAAYSTAIEKGLPVNMFVISASTAAAASTAEREGTKGPRVGGKARATVQAEAFKAWAKGAASSAILPTSMASVGGGRKSGALAHALARALQAIPMPTFSELLLATARELVGTTVEPPYVHPEGVGNGSVSGPVSAVGGPGGVGSALYPLVAASRGYPIAQPISFEPSDVHRALIIAVGGKDPALPSAAHSASAAEGGGGASTPQQSPSETVADAVGALERMLLLFGWESKNISIVADCGKYATPPAKAAPLLPTRSGILTALDKLSDNAVEDSTLFVAFIGAGSVVERSADVDDGEPLLRGFVPSDFPHSGAVTDREILQRLLRIPPTARLAMLVDTVNCPTPPVSLPYRLTATPERRSALETATEGSLNVYTPWNMRTLAEAAAARDAAKTQNV